MEIDSFKRKKQYCELDVIHKRLNSDLTLTVTMSTVVQSVPPLFIKDSDVYVGVPTFTHFDMCVTKLVGGVS